MAPGVANRYRAHRVTCPGRGLIVKQIRRPRGPLISISSSVAALAVAGALWAPGGADAAELYATKGPPRVDLTLRGVLSGTAEQVGDIRVDAADTVLEGRAGADAQGRLGARLDLLFDLPLFVRLDGEVDYLTGQLLDRPGVEGLDLPGDSSDAFTVRSAHVVLGLGSALTLGAGYLPSDWGMGLVAHGGSTEWRPQTAMFNDARGGDVVRRVFLRTGPWTGADVSLFGFVGEAVRDAQLVEGDTAQDAGGGFTFGGDALAGGLYIVRRWSEAADGAETVANVFDVHLKSTLPLADAWTLSLETEAALITGTTELAPSAEFRERDLMQIGWAGRAVLATEGVGGVLEWLYASGDQNFDDGQQNAFRPDPNYEMGLFLYRHVLAAQTGRSPITAGDPDLVGVPARDLDRLPTRGAVSNTFALFPKGYWQPLSGLTVYGGVLFAFADVPPADPRNTRLAGGDPRNALGGDPSALLGTEFDLGLRYELKVWLLALAAGLEVGYLLPGGALVDAEGDDMNGIAGGRLMVQVAF